MWAQRRTFITIIWPENPPLFGPFKNDKASNVGSYDFAPPLPSLKGESVAMWAIPALQHDWNKGRKMGEKLLFQPHKAFLPSCGRIATGSGSVFFHSGGCSVLCSPPTRTFLPFLKKNTGNYTSKFKTSAKSLQAWRIMGPGVASNILTFISLRGSK